ncbi:BMC domain-containing protein [Evansella caseinilytica]|uniref:BMC domain-containing protein n=1 Tax=Evansella caseinilytica TaxID=1503961 RepID=A0A1H3HWJ5_9BACI|nr:BMC domain-containing protein [Evansella caseinilytica]SDY19836.1 BMC domain-containing protein [Evansella caseinilytica]
MTNALGMIEVIGLTAAIEIADMMAKAADIRILEAKKTRGSGWMTVFLEGDVAAVQAAVQTAESQARQKNVFVSAKVIPRPVENVRQRMVRPLSSMPGNTNENNQRSANAVHPPRTAADSACGSGTRASSAKNNNKGEADQEKEATSAERANGQTDGKPRRRSQTTAQPAHPEEKANEPGEKAAAQKPSSRQSAAAAKKAGRKETNNSAKSTSDKKQPRKKNADNNEN